MVKDNLDMHTQSMGNLEKYIVTQPKLITHGKGWLGNIHLRMAWTVDYVLTLGKAQIRNAHSIHTP